MGTHESKGSKEKSRTITAEWRVPLYVVGSAIFLAIVMTSQWYDLRTQVQSGVSQQQFQDWLDNQREKNTTIIWSRLPPKTEKINDREGS